MPHASQQSASQYCYIGKINSECDQCVHVMSLSTREPTENS